MLISFAMLSSLLQQQQLKKVTITSFVPALNNQSFMTNLFLNSIQIKFTNDPIPVLDANSQEYQYLKSNMKVYNQEEYFAILTQFKASVMSFGCNISFRDDMLLYKEYIKTMETLPSAGFVLIENSDYERISLGTVTVPNIPGTDGTKVNIVQFAKMVRMLYPNLILTFSNINKLFFNYVEENCKGITEFSHNILIDQVESLDQLSTYIDSLVQSCIGRNLTKEEIISLINGENFNKAALVNYYAFLLTNFRLMENQATELLLLHKPMKDTYLERIKVILGIEKITRPILFDPSHQEVAVYKSLDSILSI